MRLMLVISSLQAGGAERVLSTMANFWAEKGWAVTIMTFDERCYAPFYSLDPRIRHVPLDLLSHSSNILIGVLKNLKRVWRLRRTIRENHPSTIISFIDKTNVLILLATWGMQLKVLVSERTDPNQYFFGYAWNYLRLFTYLKAEYIIVQTQRAKEYFPKLFQSKIVVIPNPVILTDVVQKANNTIDLQKPFALSIGRLVEEKGIDLLLRAFAHLAPKFPLWSLNIFGEGPLRSNLESLSNELGISGRVRFHGLISNPYDVLSQADLFVLPSRTEGFPNALLEAMASGLPVVSTDCPSGPREIIRNGENGVLVPPEDEKALSSAMAWLMADEFERKRLAICASDVVEHFSPGKIMKKWEEVLLGDVCF